MSEEKNGKSIKRFLKLILVVVLLWLSFGAGVYLSGKNEIMAKLATDQAVYLGKVIGEYQEPEPGVLSQDIDFSLFWRVWDSLKSNYVDKDKLSDKQMFYGAIKGMVASAKDPYTVFMDPVVAREFQEDLQGTFEGIGAEIGMKNDLLTIIAPLPEMPAEKAGLLSGDRILAIDKETTMGLSVDEAVNRIRGPKGTEVTLTIKRNGEDDVRDIAVKRDQITVKSVRTTKRDDGIFVVQITSFNDDTEEEFNTAVREIVDANPKGIILDLRNNPGGYLETAIEVSSEWVEDGIVVVERYSDDQKIEHLSRGRARLKSFPTVVLINQGSASASEIVSGALQDHKLATLVGKQSFGKGSVQTLEKFDDGSSVKVTVAKWLTPDGRSINDEGITPDVEVDLTLDDYNNNLDPQMDKAVEILTGNNSGAATGNNASTSDQMEN